MNNTYTFPDVKYYVFVACACAAIIPLGAICGVLGVAIQVIGLIGMLTALLWPDKS